MQDSIFTKIIKGEIPCHKIFEDERTIAFLDIYPIQPGHILVVPKRQIDHLDDIDDDEYNHLFEVVKLLSKRVKTVMGAKRAGLAVQGFDIPHAHIHIIPCNRSEDFYNLPDRTVEPDHENLAQIAKKLIVEDKN